jgi:uncharacterized membrane protein
MTAALRIVFSLAFVIAASASTALDTPTWEHLRETGGSDAP